MLRLCFLARFTIASTSSSGNGTRRRKRRQHGLNVAGQRRRQRHAKALFVVGENDAAPVEDASALGNENLQRRSIFVGKWIVAALVQHLQLKQPPTDRREAQHLQAAQHERAPAETAPRGSLFVIVIEHHGCG